MGDITIPPSLGLVAGVAARPVAGVAADPAAIGAVVAGDVVKTNP